MTCHNPKLSQRSLRRIATAEFSRGFKLTDNAVSYIQKQRMRHQAQTFQDEYLEMLDKHGVEYDEQYLWG